MRYRNLKLVLMGCALVLGFQTGLMGQIFFTESFDYADGDLATVSKGLWAGHSGAEPDIQVVSGDAVITAPGDMDDNRLTGSVMGVNDVWYYAVRFSVELGSGQNINNDYFIHFKDDSTFGFNARLATVAPSDTGDFSLQIWASSFGDGMADWNGDFDFGEEIIAVVEWNNGTGDATLWVNPVDINSTSITDTELIDAMRLTESVALRQDSTASSIVTVPVLSVGTDFDAVLAEVASQKLEVPADSYFRERGIQTGGTPPPDPIDTEESDDSYVSFNPGLTLNPNEAPVTLFFDGTLSTDSPASLNLVVEASAVTAGQFSTTLSAWNWNTSAWVEVDVRATTSSDSVTDIDLTASISDYVQSGTGAVRARVEWRLTGFAAQFPWEVQLDQLVWKVNQ